MTDTEVKSDRFLVGFVLGCFVATVIFMWADYKQSNYWRNSYCYASKSEAQFCMDVLQERAEFDAWRIELGIMEDQTND